MEISDRFFNAFNLFNYVGVVDFIDVGIEFYRFCIFNFADSFIIIGVIFYIYSFIVLACKMNEQKDYHVEIPENN